ncbi:hypothetical protein HPB50_000130 [Hyalomma asiaticum]|uniref:Uncharacterized protein n=1 Tax=Hyalomma asiaticum TaxID=266040 RepID=A0ACB7TCI9_HYAAI|nr:hypothetical protein HPB50_000130 [Hyalomma asiaticum]
MSFSGYRVSRPTLDPDFKQARGIATLIRNDISFVERDTPTYKKGLESILTEIIPSRALKAHLYILNLYSSPTDRLRNFTKLFTSAALQAKDRPLIVAGDFNAHNTLWGYATNDRKGINLAAAGTAILLEAGIQPLFMPPEKSQLFTNAKKAITVDPIPRNIHPTHNEGRRKARAKAILDKIKHNETKVLFVDAARNWNRGAYAVSVVDAHGSLVNAATVVTNFTHEAEEMAIAVALRSCTGASVIYSDSRTAIRTFSAALVSSKAVRVSRSDTVEQNDLLFFPNADGQSFVQARVLGKDRPTLELAALSPRPVHEYMDGHIHVWEREHFFTSTDTWRGGLQVLQPEVYL